MISSVDEIYKISSLDENISIVSVDEIHEVIESREVLNYNIYQQLTAFFCEEKLNGIDGLNTIFATSQNFKNGSTQLFLNGLKEMNYIEISNNHINTLFTPSINGFDDELIIRYEVL